MKPYEPSEWEDNEPAAKPQTTLVIRVPRFFCSRISILTKRRVALGTKTFFPLLRISRPLSEKLSATRMSYLQMT